MLRDIYSDDRWTILISICDWLVSLPPTSRPASVARRCWPERRFVVCVRRPHESPSSDPPKLLGTSGPRVLPILPIYRSALPCTTHRPQEIGFVRSWLQRKPIFVSSVVDSVSKTFYVHRETGVLSRGTVSFSDATLRYAEEFLEIEIILGYRYLVPDYWDYSRWPREGGLYSHSTKRAVAN